MTFVCCNDNARKPMVMNLVGELGFWRWMPADLSQARLLAVESLRTVYGGAVRPKRAYAGRNHLPYSKRPPT